MMLGGVGQHAVEVENHRLRARPAQPHRLGCDRHGTGVIGDRHRRARQQRIGRPVADRHAAGADCRAMSPSAGSPAARGRSAARSGVRRSARRGRPSPARAPASRPPAPRDEAHRRYCGAGRRDRRTPPHRGTAARRQTRRCAPRRCRTPAPTASNRARSAARNRRSSAPSATAAARPAPSPAPGQRYPAWRRGGGTASSDHGRGEADGAARAADRPTTVGLPRKVSSCGLTCCCGSTGSHMASAAAVQPAISSPVSASRVASAR